MVDTKGVLEDMKGKLGTTTDESEKGQATAADRRGSMAQPGPHTEHVSGSMYGDPKESEAAVGVCLLGAVHAGSYDNRGSRFYTAMLGCVHVSVAGMVSCSASIIVYWRALIFGATFLKSHMYITGWVPDDEGS